MNNKLLADKEQKLAQAFKLLAESEARAHQDSDERRELAENLLVRMRQIPFPLLVWCQG